MSEFNLQVGQGRSRLHHFFWCEVKDVYNFIIRQRQELDQRTFMFPHILKDRTLFTAHVDKHEEMLIDLRDAMDLSNLKSNASKNSLNSELPVIR